ncbi:MAG: hypothetical protein J5525_12915 [Lachnospiraceae bacterium]|nr:hypothetical protein [Lachnospiraceae bacterium]
MKKNRMQTDDNFLKAEIYTELINDMQAKITKFKGKYPECVNDELVKIDQQLTDARMLSRIYIDEMHFAKWEDLLTSAKAAMIKSQLFK